MTTATSATTSATAPFGDIVGEDTDPGRSSAALCINFGVARAASKNANNDNSDSHNQKPGTKNDKDDNGDDNVCWFRPRFTHQIFEKERICGYQPPNHILYATQPAATNEEEEHEQQLSHPSYQHHESTSHCLQIYIRLAPSWNICHVRMEITRKRPPPRSLGRRRREQSEAPKSSPAVTDEKDNSKTHLSRRTSKRPRLGEAGENIERVDAGKDDLNDDGEDEEEDEDEEEEYPDGNDKDDDYCDPAEDEDEDDDNNEEDNGEDECPDDRDTIQRRTRDREPAQRPLTAEEIKALLAPALPATSDNVRLVNQATVSHDLVGTRLHLYQRNEQVFVVTLANGSDAHVQNYHESVQRLSPWFIETADAVDIGAENQGGFWKVLYLFAQFHPNNQLNDERDEKTSYFLVGYYTLFHFHALFRKPHPGIIVRICQALILPPYQRQGHGRELLHVVHGLAHGAYKNALPTTTNGSAIEQQDEMPYVEMNVEDPAPGFSALRDSVDYELYQEKISEFGNRANPVTSSDTKEETLNVPLGEAEASEIAVQTKTTTRQVQIVYEIWKLDKLRRRLKAISADSSESEQAEVLEKHYRLMVKKRMNKELREHLSTFRTKAEMQAELDKEYRKRRFLYDAILDKQENLMQQEHRTS